jgi:hypothetical protein
MGKAKQRQKTLLKYLFRAKQKINVKLIKLGTFGVH